MCWLSKYEPIGLDDIVGQCAPINRLKKFRDNPFPACFLLEGPGGVGKTASAHALAHDLGCRPFPEHAFSGLHVIRGEELSVDLARDFFGNRGRSPLDLYPQTEWPREKGPGWHVVIIEELDWISPQAQKALKTNLDGRNLRPRCVVEGLSWEKVSISIESRLRAYRNEKFSESAFFRREWTASRCRHTLDQFKQVLAEEEKLQRELAE